MSKDVSAHPEWEATIAAGDVSLGGTLAIPGEPRGVVVFAHGSSAVVSRGGRPDLAGNMLERVRCPTLLLVGGDDDTVLHLNQEALERLRVEKDLQVIPGATHLFEEPGALEEVSRSAREWFVRYLKSATRKQARRPSPSADAPP